MTSSRFLIPAVLGIVATVANFVILRQATATAELVALRGDLKAGEVITAAHLKAVPVRGDRALYRGAVLYVDASAVIGMKVRRAVSAGELLLRADVDSLEFLDWGLVPDGHTTVTLTARKGVVDTRPTPGKFVDLIARRTGATRDGSGPSQFGPYRLIGWASVIDPAGKETDLVRIVVAVPRTGDPQVEELRAQQGGSADWLVAVEVAQPMPEVRATGSR